MSHPFDILFDNIFKELSIDDCIIMAKIICPSKQCYVIIKKEVILETIAQIVNYNEIEVCNIFIQLLYKINREHLYFKYIKPYIIKEWTTDMINKLIVSNDFF